MIQTSIGTFSPESLVDELTYLSYRHNRQTMSAESLASLFPKSAAAMESRYQAELRIPSTEAA